MPNAYGSPFNYRPPAVETQPLLDCGHGVYYEGGHRLYQNHDGTVVGVNIAAVLQYTDPQFYRDMGYWLEPGDAWYWAQQPPAVQQLRHVRDFYERGRLAGQLHELGYEIDFMIMVWGHSATATMQQRKEDAAIGRLGTDMFGNRPPIVDIPAGLPYPGVLKAPSA